MFAHRTRTRSRARQTRLVALTLAAVLGACAGDPFSFDHGSVRVLAVVGNYYTGRQLVEYSAPPLREVRRMALDAPGAVIHPLLRDRAGGGFFALLDGGTSLARYDAGWHVAAVVALDTPYAFMPYLAWTADQRYLVMTGPSGYGTARTLDPRSLATVRDFHAPAAMQTAATSGATGHEMLFTPYTDWCPRPLVWKDVETGTTTDSTGLPCGYDFYAMRTRQQLYRRGPSGAPPGPFELYDVGTGQVLAVRDSLLIIWPSTIFLDLGRRQLINLAPGGVVEALDALSLAERWRLTLAPGGKAQLRAIASLMLDPVTGALVGTTASCYGLPCGSGATGIIVVDAASHALAVDHELGRPVQLVR